MSRRKAHPSSPRKIGKHIIMWGLILCVTVAIGLGIREIPALDPREYVGRNANQAIELWVELRDQHDRPLVQHPVDAHLVHWHNGPQRETDAKMTDDKGRLHLVGRNHCGISLELDPEAYLPTHLMARWYTSPFATSLREGMYRTDWGTADQPTICRVLRKEGPQVLMEVWGRVYFPYRSGPIYINLRDGLVTADANKADLALFIDLGEEIKRESDFDMVDKTPKHPPGSLFYPKRTMRLEAIRGWIEPLPRDFNWYRKFVHAALPYKAADVMEPQSLRMIDGDLYGGFSGDYFLFGTRDGAVHGKGVISVSPGKGPGQDPLIQIRAVINSSGSKSFEHTTDAISVQQMGLDSSMAPQGYVPNMGFNSPATWDMVHPEVSLVPKSAR